MKSLIPCGFATLRSNLRLRCGCREWLQRLEASTENRFWDRSGYSWFLVRAFTKFLRLYARVRATLAALPLALPDAMMRHDREIFFTGPVDACDAYGRLLADEPGFGDVALHGAYAPRGLLCLPCCAADGVKWGWGRGPQYVRQPDGWWELRRGLR